MIRIYGLFTSAMFGVAAWRLGVPMLALLGLGLALLALAIFLAVANRRG
jgi:hypothetical protein